MRALALGIRRIHTVATIVSARLRAQWLRVEFPHALIDRRARLGRGARVYVAPGGRLEIGPCTISDSVTIQVAENAALVLHGKYVGPSSVLVARQSIVIEPGAMIAEMCVIRDADHTRDSSGGVSNTHYVSMPVRIEQDAWLGAGVTILKGVVIGRAATVGAGAVVTRTVPPGATAYGAAARVVDSPEAS